MSSCQVCPKPEMKYEAQKGLTAMEEAAARTAPVLHRITEKWALKALALRAEAHFAHLHSPVAVANCALCKTSVAGHTVINWVLEVTTINPGAPYPIP
jgi:hypothetical protein